MARLAAILLLVGGAHALELALSPTSTSPPTHTHTHNLLKWTSPSSSRPLHAREPPLGSPRMSALPLPTRSPPPRIDDRADADAAAAERLTVVGAGVNVVLSATKAVAGTAAHSPAMLADAAHSLSDLLSDGITLWAVRASVSRKTGYISIGDLKFPLF
jgi:Co/Zn/Cd efflux system component